MTEENLSGDDSEHPNREPAGSDASEGSEPDDEASATGADDVTDGGAEDGPDSTGPVAPIEDDDIAESETAEQPPDIRVQELDRIFSLLEEAFTSDALEGQQLERLLSVLEGAIVSSSETDPETLAEFVALLEDIVVEPDDLSQVDVDGMLSVLERTLAETTGQQFEQSEDVFGVLAEALRDPTQIDPDDVERFRSGIESAIVDMTGSQGLGQLFSSPGVGATESVPETDSEVDPFRIARLAAGMTQRATGYSIESGMRTGTRMAYAAANTTSPAELLTETRAITLDELDRAGIDVGEEQAEWLERHEDDIVQGRPVTRERLRERGERLLSQSAELGRDESLHPAFNSVLEDLAADEARILRLLAQEGPQPTLDVYDKGYIPFRATLFAQNLSRVGSDAGCRQPARTPTYFQNLERLGLIEFTEDPVDDLKRYQVLEAQPHIENARAEARRPKTTYGTVRLTDFGIEFCETCLPVTVTGHRPTARFWEEAE